MSYKSRGNWAPGQKISEERWNQIFGGKNESEIRPCNGVSNSGIDVFGESTECNQEERIRENYNESECQDGSTTSGNFETNCPEDSDRLPSIHSGSWY